MIPEKRTPKLFHPEMVSRRGEYTAWGLTVFSFFAWVLLRGFESPFSKLSLILWVFFLASAVIISFGNWVDRNTEIKLDIDGVGFKNGLRNIWLQWDDILSVSVFPGQWGTKRIRVFGKRGRFDFRTYGQAKYKGEVKGEMGFVHGEHIFQTMITSANLEIVDSNGAQNYYYYSRK